MQSFKSTKRALKHKTTAEIKQGVLLFKSFNYPILIKYGPAVVDWCLKIGFPIKGLIKKTLFPWFCGGENISECHGTIENLAKNNVGTILDYSVEGDDNASAFDNTKDEIIATIHAAAKTEHIPFSVFKSTGIVHNDILLKVSNDETLNEVEQKTFVDFKKRFEEICKAGFDHKVRVFVDAEESWLQAAIDSLTYEMMAKYNIEDVYIFNTIQLYRHDRLAHLSNQIKNQSYKQGYKLVRGAYLEKENLRAEEMNYPTPMQQTKENTDRDYDAAVALCVAHLDQVAFCAGTHNELSSSLLVDIMKEKALPNDHPHIWFAQLLGMSDHISFNLADMGYNVAKYVPYGPVKSVLPYLARRAQENSSIAGQMGRELVMLREELKRRKSN
jgi:proline dehydrogenase